MTLTQVSLFTGVGGFDLAGERAGVKPAAMCDDNKPQAGHLIVVDETQTRHI
jgi:site-specific DNA-cytosine methylase